MKEKKQFKFPKASVRTLDTRNNKNISVLTTNILSEKCFSLDCFEHTEGQNLLKSEAEQKQLFCLFEKLPITLRFSLFSYKSSF